MKSAFFSLFFFASLLSAGQGNNSLILASDVWPPFTNVEGEKRIAIDIVQEALNRIEIENSIYIDDFEDVMIGINEEVFSGSAALWYTDKRAKSLLFSKPYLHNQLILVGRKGSDVNAKSIDELGKVKIGVVENYAYDEAFLKNPNIEIVKDISDQKNMERLLSKKVDYILVDALLLQYLLKYQTNDVSQFLEIGTTPLSIKALHFALNANIEGAEEIITLFNQEIDKMMSDGTYHEILELNWIQTDIDGDGELEMVLIGDQAGENEPSNAYSVDPNKQSITNEGFYINGEYYLTWEQVPAELKVNMTDPDNSYYHEGGIILKF